MYSIPDNFLHDLETEFHNKYRIRWSNKLNEFQLEQKVAPGRILEPPPIDPEAFTLRYDMEDDAWIRARDGYFYVMSLRNGDRMPCPICGFTVTVPVMETRESRCENCRIHGRDGRYVAAFYPFNHILLEHLKDIDPENGGPQRVRQRIRARQQEKMERDRREGLDNADYQVLFNKNQVENNPLVGYGPKTSRYANGEVTADFFKE